jgi:hypothetical protein
MKNYCWGFILLACLMSCHSEHSNQKKDYGQDNSIISDPQPDTAYYDFNSIAYDCTDTPSKKFCSEEWSRAYGVSQVYAEICHQLGHQVIDCEGCNKRHGCSKNLRAKILYGDRPKSLGINKTFLTANACLVFVDSEITCADIETSEELTALELQFINECETDGGEVLRCGCSHKYICI